MEPNTINLLFGLFFVILGISLLIMSILDIRTYQDTDNQTIKDNIDFINTCSNITMIVSACIILIGIIFMIRSKRQEFFDFFFSLSPKIKSVMIGIIGLLILIVGSLQRVKINNILPDMSNENAVKSYNDNHTVSASSVLGSNMGIIVIGIMLLLSGITHFFMNQEEVKEIPKENPPTEIPKENPPKVQITSEAKQQYDKNRSKLDEWKKQLNDNPLGYDEHKMEEERFKLAHAEADLETAWAKYKSDIATGIASATAATKQARRTVQQGSLSTPVSELLNR
jgi:hypothetical protein